MAAPASTDEKSPFSLELVAKVAAILLVQKPDRSVSADRRAQAADEAVRLIEACQDRIDRHQQISRLEQPPPDHREVAARERAIKVESIKKSFGDSVPFGKGIKEITGQKTETKSTEWFRAWRRYELSRSNYGHGERRGGETSLGDPIETRIISELKMRRANGFPAARFVQMQEEFALWKKEHPRQGPGMKKV